MRQQRVRMPMPSLACAPAIEPAHEQLAHPLAPRSITFSSALSSLAWVCADMRVRKSSAEDDSSIFSFASAIRQAMKLRHAAAGMALALVLAGLIMASDLGLF
jgi:hypothetical protein